MNHPHENLRNRTGEVKLDGIRDLTGRVDSTQPALMTVADIQGPETPLDAIRTSVFSRQAFVQIAAEKFAKTSPEELAKIGIIKDGNVISLGMRMRLPLARKESAVMTLHDGKEGTNPEKARYFNLGGNAMYFDGQGQMVGIDLEWGHAVNDAFWNLRKKDGGTITKLAKVNFSFGGHFNLGITAFPESGENYKFSVDRHGKVQNSDLNYPGLVKKAAEIAIPEFLLSGL